jgi:hypothetical protein
VRKLVVIALLAAAVALLARRLRPRSPGPVDRPQAAPPRPASPPAPAAAPPPPTTNGERVVLMSVSSLQGRGQAVTADAVVAHVGAGELHPDEGTVDVVLHRLAGAGLLSGGDGNGSYRLTATGQAALLDGSPARPSPAADAAEELSTPATNA